MGWCSIIVNKNSNLLKSILELTIGTNRISFYLKRFNKIF